MTAAPPVPQDDKLSDAEIAAQLRKLLNAYPLGTMDWPLDVMQSAATALERRASPQIAALEPFVKLAARRELEQAVEDDYMPLHIGLMNGNVTQSVIRGALTVGDLRRLAATCPTPRDDGREWAAALGDLCAAYVRLMEAGRDKIIELGGQCDPVDVMERNDPFLLKARATLARHCPAPKTKGEG